MENLVLTKIKNALESFYLIPAIFAFAVIGRIFDIVNVTLPIIAMTIVLVLIFCDDVKNIFAIIFYAPFYIDDLNVQPNRLLYGIAIVSVVLALLYFTVRKIIFLKKRNLLVKGKLYLPLIIITIAYLLGGVTVGFDLNNAVTIIVFSLVSFFFYFIALNCVKDAEKFLYKVFVSGAIFVSFMVLFENFVNFGDITYIFHRSMDTFVGAENVNVVALFIFLGICGIFGLGYKTKHDITSVIIAIVFYFFIIVTYCRMAMLVGALAIMTFVVISFLASSHKKNYVICLGVLFAILVVSVMLLWDVVKVLERELSYKTLLGGREELWPWCIEMFKQNFMFGIGFKISGEVPAMGVGAEHYVLAHNTLLQWITSLGIIGTVCMLTFTVVKYRILTKNFFGKGLFLRLMIIFIAISGITDQSPQMDPFVYNIVIVVIASIESMVFHHKQIKEVENEKDRLKDCNKQD